MMKKILLFISCLLLSACVYYSYEQVDMPDVKVVDKTRYYDLSNERYLNYPITIRTVSGLCLDNSGSDYNGIIAFKCHGKANQQFKFIGNTIQIQNLCLDIAGEQNQDGAKVIAYSCHGKLNQQWFLHGQEIRSALNGKCLDVVKNGNKSTVQQCDGSQGQRFIY